MNPQTLLPEFEHEMSGTRKPLACVPDEHLDWRPHEKSFTLRELATHLANLPKWVGISMSSASVDYLTVPPDEPVPSAAAATERFDARVEEVKELINNATPEAWGEPWTFRVGDQERFTTPRLAAYRMMVMNHIFHHRGQLTVYLRLLNTPVPGLYGPSADEK